MDVMLRPGTPDDAQACGRICFEAFGAISARHGFPADIPAVEVGIGVASMMLGHPRFYSVVAEIDGQVVGSNFLDERSEIVGVGPITVAPDSQDRGVGRALMLDVMGRAADRSATGVRLLQAAYHGRSLSLYAKLGFAVRDVLACMQGPPLDGRIAGYEVRPATAADLDACAAVCTAVHGHHRTDEVSEAITHGTARVVEHGGAITGYATDVGFFAHAAAEGNAELQALISAAPAFAGPGVLVPMTNADLFRWCLDQGLTVVHVMTLMTTGFYRPPQGGYLPSVLF